MLKLKSPKALSMIGIVAGLSLLGPTSEALVVETDGKVVFDSGGFEDGVVGIFPVAPTVGSYRFNQEGKVEVSTGQSDDDHGPSGAASGENYLKVDRTGGGAIRAAEFSEPIDPNKQSFSIEWKDWGQGKFTAYSVGAAGVDGTSGSTENLLSAFGIHGGGDGPGDTRFVSFNHSKMGGTTTLDLPYQFGQWNLIRYEWDAGKKQATLTVNGESVSIKTHSQKLPPLVEQFFFRGNTKGAVIYIDAATEAQAEPE